MGSKLSFAHVASPSPPCDIRHIFRGSSTAERSAVNREGAGSTPAPGPITSQRQSAHAFRSKRLFQRRVWIHLRALPVVEGVDHGGKRSGPGGSRPGRGSDRALDAGHRTCAARHCGLWFAYAVRACARLGEAHKTARGRTVHLLSRPTKESWGRPWRPVAVTEIAPDPCDNA